MNIFLGSKSFNSKFYWKKNSKRKFQTSLCPVSRKSGLTPYSEWLVWNQTDLSAIKAKSVSSTYANKGSLTYIPSAKKI